MSCQWLVSEAQKAAVAVQHLVLLAVYKHSEQVSSAAAESPPAPSYSTARTSPTPTLGLSSPSPPAFAHSPSPARTFAEIVEMLGKGIESKAGKMSMLVPARKFKSVLTASLKNSRKTQNNGAEINPYARSDQSIKPIEYPVIKRLWQKNGNLNLSQFNP